MASRRRRHAALIFLLSSLTGAIGAPASTDGLDPTVAQDAALSAITNVAAQAPTSSKAWADLGTKHAPVDGKDGKPHAGPWVGVGADRDQDALGEAQANDGAPGKKPAPRPMTEAVMPKANDGVMNDPNRQAPKKGTTGTEGGVSEKERDRKALEGQTGERAEKRPDPPKEAPPLPHSEEEKIRVTEESKDGGGDNEREAIKDDAATLEDSNGAELGGLAVGFADAACACSSYTVVIRKTDVGRPQNPVDLPPKPHDAPLPTPPTIKTDLLGALPLDGDGESPQLRLAAETNGLIQPLHSLALSMTMILFSEIGDKTFLVAALMAMKHPRPLVFSAAFTALIAMTVLSAVLGHAVPTLIPKWFTNFLAAALFLIFGLKMLREGYQMSPEENASEEMKEVEMEMQEREHKARGHGRHRRSSPSPFALESGLAGGSPRKPRSKSRLPSAPRSPSLSPSRSPSPSRAPSAANVAVTVRNTLAGLNNLLTFLLSPAWVQTFVMTFLGEWGDRSQIATIAMAAGQDYWWVTIGAVTGHAVCTAVAVIGGRAIAGKVSIRVVTLGGAIAFIVFGVIYLAEALYYPPSSTSASTSASSSSSLFSSSSSFSSNSR
ncbi:MAG: hypothetical protein M1815_002114 [Lichina confinis]|nr:MAG: hypothetical protein M1815_002114 [Lichina confinis]